MKKEKEMPELYSLLYQRLILYSSFKSYLSADDLRCFLGLNNRIPRSSHMKIIQEFISYKILIRENPNRYIVIRGK